MTTTIIQLVSAQAMQNLLPVLAFNACRVAELYTPGFLSKLGIVARASQAAHHALESTAIELSKMPSIEETKNQVARLIDFEKASGNLPVVNFTGATKLMSIGAWQAAKNADVPSVYVDTQTGEFIDGGTSTSVNITALMPGGDLSFKSVTAKLNVDVIAATNGMARVTAGREEAQYSSVTKILLHDHPLEQVGWEVFRGREGIVERALGNANFTVRDANQCLDLLETPLKNLPDTLADAGVESGLFEETQKGIFLSSNVNGRNLFDEADYLLRNRLTRDNYRRRLGDLREALEFPINFFTGAWLEAAVAEKMRASKKFYDVRWSVNVGEQDGYDLEEDIVAIIGVQLAYVSCKRSDRLLAHAEEISARAGRIGGQFTNKYYVVHKMPYGSVLDDLKQRCNELGKIQLVSSRDLAAENPFN